MTFNVKKITMAGLARMQYSIIGTGGSYAYGAATTLANGSDSGAVEVSGINALDVDIPDRRYVQVLGDDTVVSQFSFDPDSLPSGTFELGVFPAEMAALMSGSLVYDEGGLSESHLSPIGGTRPQAMLIFSSHAQSQDAGSVGEAGYWHTFFHKCDVDITGDNGLGNASAASFGGSLSTTIVGTTGWGRVLTTGNDGVVKIAGTRFWSPYKVTQHAFIGDGAATTFTLSQTVAASDGNTVQVWDDGVLQTYTTNYTASGTTLTLVGTARAAGVEVQVIYGHT